MSWRDFFKVKIGGFEHFPKRKLRQLPEKVFIHCDRFRRWRKLTFPAGWFREISTWAVSRPTNPDFLCLA